MGLNPVGSTTELLLDDSTATSATASATSEAVDRTASAASEIRREKSLTDNFCAVREDAAVLATGAKAEQLVADEARMQKRELAIDDDFMVDVLIFHCGACVFCYLLYKFLCQRLVVPKKHHRQRLAQRKIQGGG